MPIIPHSRGSVVFLPLIELGWSPPEFDVSRVEGNAFGLGPRSHLPKFLKGLFDHLLVHFPHGMCLFAKSLGYVSREVIMRCPKATGSPHIAAMKSKKTHRQHRELNIK